MKPYYEHNGITIYHGDCKKILPELRADHIITDPPYDPKTHRNNLAYLRPNRAPVDFDPIDPKWVVPLLCDSCDGWILAFCSLEMLGIYKLYAQEKYIRSGFWRRTNGCPQFTGDRPGQPGEGIAIMHNSGKKKWNGGGAHAFWEFNTPRNRFHPTTKPIELLNTLIQLFTQENDLIIDPFMGSGTTLIAAKQLGRRAVGIEIQKKYCDTAIELLAQEILLI